MGTHRRQCRLCTARLATVALLALAASCRSVVYAANLPAGQAQLPFVLSQTQGHQEQYQAPLRQEQASSRDWSLPESSTNAQPYADDAILRISFDGLRDEQVNELLVDLEVGATQMIFSLSLQDSHSPSVLPLQAAQVDIWQWRRNKYADIRVSPDFYEKSLYQSINDRTTVTIPSVERIIEQERQVQRSASLDVSAQNHASLTSDPSGGLHSLYHSYSSIESLLELFASDYPNFAKLEKIGESAQGRNIVALRISDYRKNKKASERQGTWRTWSHQALRKIWPENVSSSWKAKPKPKHKLGFALLGGQHAREWISPAALLYMAHSLIYSASQASTSSFSAWSDEQHDIMTLLSDYELHFIPLANPDGYVYAWEHDRLWVRTRQHLGHNDTRCHGIDLNRNWGYKWEKPYRPNPCSDLYPGSEPFEAVELRAIKEYLERIKASTRMDVFLDIHSFGQMSESLPIHPGTQR